MRSIQESKFGNIFCGFLSRAYQDFLSRNIGDYKYSIRIPCSGGLSYSSLRTSLCIIERPFEYSDSKISISGTPMELLSCMYKWYSSNFDGSGKSVPLIESCHLLEWHLWRFYCMYLKENEVRTFIFTWKLHDKPIVIFAYIWGLFYKIQNSDSDLEQTTKRPRANWSNQRALSWLIGFWMWNLSSEFYKTDPRINDSLNIICSKHHSNSRNNPP